MERCTPFRFVAETLELRGRLGGSAPVGVAPVFRDNETGYFATLPISDSLDVSIFMSTSDAGSNRSIGKLAHQIHDRGCKFIEAVVHQPAPRSKKSRYWELVSPVSLRPLPSTPDVDPNWAGCPYMDHKMGGQPGLIPGSQRWDEPLQQLFGDGFGLLVQVAFPGSEDIMIEESWPFGEMSFYMFHRDRGGEHTFKFLWTR